MIDVLLTCGLGNWLFQYAAARALALRHGTCAQLSIAEERDPRGVEIAAALRFFRIRARIRRNGHRPFWAGLWKGEPQETYNERVWGYDPSVLAVGKNARLLGYFQSPKYWTGFEHEIRRDLTPCGAIKDRECVRMAARIGSSNAVSVHVRRGDYVGAPLHDVCDLDYFDRAIHLLRKRLDRPQFFVFSDDLDTCRNAFAAADTLIVEVSGARSFPPLDLWLMSRCRHHVISNSTFSWWGAWLDPVEEKLVVAPDRWFNDDNMNRLAMRDTVPRQWLRVCARAPVTRESGNRSAAVR